MPSKKIRLRLYADENFPISSVTYLKSLGISIVHAYDLKLINTSDKKHIATATKLKRTIITLDRDFLYYSDIPLHSSFGAIIIATGNATPLHINTVCKKALPNISPSWVKGAYIQITVSKITRRKKGMFEEKI